MKDVWKLLLIYNSNDYLCTECFSHEFRKYVLINPDNKYVPYDTLPMCCICFLFLALHVFFTIIYRFVPPPMILYSYSKHYNRIILVIFCLRDVWKEPYNIILFMWCYLDKYILYMTKTLLYDTLYVVLFMCYSWDEYTLYNPNLTIWY